MRHCESCGIELFDYPDYEEVCIDCEDDQKDMEEYWNNLTDRERADIIKWNSS